VQNASIVKLNPPLPTNAAFRISPPPSPIQPSFPPKHKSTGVTRKKALQPDLLIQSSPQFVPAQELAAQNLIEQGKTKEAIALLEEATTRFPSSPELARMRVEALSQENQPLEASIAARQFAIVNPDHPDAEEFTKLADDNLKKFRGNLRERIAFRGLGGLAIGILTGRTQSTIFQGVQLAQLMIAGESGLGKQVAEQVKKEEKIITDSEVVAYIDKLGQNIAKYMGRDEFEYEFNVIEDEGINAFALPGGKVFVNTGAILAANSEAELAGLLAHEISHAVLSHGFERIMTNNLLANLSREIPLGDILGTLVSLSYSRDKERQADLIGARVLNSAGYAADGLRNFMVTLSQERGASVPAILSSHPAPPDRIRYLEELIIKNGYNRYSFEGVEQLAQIQARL
jgi:predicted Zn-dependent protease